MEIWKDIEGYEGYQVSNLGRVKNIKTNKLLKGNLLSGYKRVHFPNKKVFIHTLVAQAFIPKPENKPCIDHINADRTDNRVENLRWVTAKENSDNPITKVKHLKKLKEKHSKPIIQFSLNGEFIKKWNSAAEIAKEMGLFSTSIIACCRFKTHHKTCGGFIWCYHYKSLWLKNHIPLKYIKKVA